MKQLNVKNKLELLKVPYESEKQTLFKKYHDDRGHISYRRVYREIIEQKYIWKSLRNDCLNYVNNCPYCIRLKSGKSYKPIPTQIIPKGPQERYVVDSWKIHKELSQVTGYNWVIDIIDHFSKFLMSFPIVQNDAINTLNCIKEFCVLKGMPKIIQSDNGSEYKNSLIEEFCNNNNIKHIYSSPYHPSTNGVVEVCHKEVRKQVIIYYAQNPDNFNLKNVILNAVQNHNNNIHTVTQYRPVELFNNTDEDVYNKVIDNIKKVLLMI